ncbi:carbohydate-binding domain-containing protein [Pontibacter sp. E15-1]|uniref:family 20 glycosylhydrolase n=1 Tax=Pontibacter sp. E15-1 TaxID=2919918 RepID=UPI001F503C73|nr:family 20 glycosylhydrolase [Pontibacter sp. E15-1]MCJ8163548.1 carbohydate-binding domain-containing protein [Pontibacter sp. E15-1]
MNPNQLDLVWEVKQEKYQGKTQTLSTLTLKNTSQQTLPATGWSLYFNASPSLKPDGTNAPVKVEHINGDLLRMVPAASFKGLSPGSSLPIAIVTGGQMINESRVPDGFYFVWDEDNTKGLAVGDVTYLKPSRNDVGWIKAEEIYAQNSTITDIPEAQLTKIFPSPAQYTETGAAFTLTADVPLVADDRYSNVANLLAAYLGTVFGRKPAVQASGSGKAIRLQHKAGLGPEAYTLQVTSEGILISASTPAGMFYGTQSVKSLIPPAALATTQKALTIPGVEVQDAPRFGHRAFMMDVARNFQKKEQVLKVLDLMALYKLNVLHFHLNDDEGWRLEIPALPELTELGSKRGHTLDDSQNLVSALGSGPTVDASSGSGYYSKADFIEILAYATARHIRVIPEIETPGHARAAIKAMDARYTRLMAEGKKAEATQYLLRDLNDKSVYRSVQNWNDNVIDVALPSTYTFLEKVVDEMLAMYKEAGAPIQTVHFGGDEVPQGVWTKSPAVQQLMASNPKVNNTDDLWYYYFGKVNDMLKARKLYLSGWEEIGMRKVKQNGKTAYIANPDFANENFHVDVWNNLGSNVDLAYRMANAGYKVVLTNVTNLYLDLAYQKAYEEPGLNWGGYVDLDKPFYFIPFDYMKNMKVDTENKPISASAFAGKERLTEAGKKNIVGLQAPLWSETVTTPERLEYMLLPKLLGLAERAWAPDPSWATETDAAKSEAAYARDWSSFVNVLGKRELPRLNYYGKGFQYRIPTAGAKTENGKIVANVQLPGLTIRYTTDGTEPTTQSKQYTGPIAAKGTVNFKVFDGTGRSGKVTTVGAN